MSSSQPTRWFVRLLGLLLLGLVLWQGWMLGWVLWWRDHDPRQTHFMAQRLAELREKNSKAELRHVWVPYEKISI
ncbi:MAG: monofunctional biosynthetic peptidoglycan transglycosylase, partial [Rhodocyclaceae bacterium]